MGAKPVFVLLCACNVFKCHFPFWTEGTCNVNTNSYQQFLHYCGRCKKKETWVCWNPISKLMNRSQSNFREYLLCLRRLPPPQSETVHTTSTSSSSLPNLSNIGHNMLWRGEPCIVETVHTQPVQYWPQQFMCGCTSVETGHTPPHPPPRVQQEGAICAQNQFVQYVEDLKRECKSAFAHSVHLEFSDFRQCSHITVFSSSSSSPTTTTSSSSLSLPPTVKGGEGGWVAPLEEENNYLGHIHTQTLLHTHTQRHTTTQMHKYDNT